MAFGAERSEVIEATRTPTLNNGYDVIGLPLMAGAPVPGPLRAESALSSIPSPYTTTRIIGLAPKDMFVDAAGAGDQVGPISVDERRPLSGAERPSTLGDFLATVPAEGSSMRPLGQRRGFDEPGGAQDPTLGVLHTHHGAEIV